MNLASEVLVSVRASAGNFMKLGRGAVNDNFAPGTTSAVPVLPLPSSTSAAAARYKFDTEADVNVKKDTSSPDRLSTNSNNSTSDDKVSINPITTITDQMHCRDGTLELIRMSDANYMVLFKAETKKGKTKETRKNRESAGTVPTLASSSTDSESDGDKCKSEDDDNLYEKEEEENSVPVLITSDLDDVKFVDKWSSVVLLDGGYMISIVNSTEYNILKIAREDCVSITKLTLRLNSITRDAFFSGFHATLHEMRQDETVSGKEIAKTERALYDIPNQNKIFRDVVSEMATTFVKGSPESSSSSSGGGRGGSGGGACASGASGSTRGGNRRGSKSKSVLVSLGDNAAVAEGGDAETYLFGTLKCIYCDLEKVQRPDLEFVTHPYCPYSHDKEMITMCVPCATNWDAFRTKLEASMGSLVLPDEVNEELCALCSDTPEELLLCSFCPRSFCQPCLARSLKTPMLEQLRKEKEADWACHACATGLGKKKPTGKGNWKKVNWPPVSPIHFGGGAFSNLSRSMLVGRGGGGGGGSNAFVAPSSHGGGDGGGGGGGGAGYCNQAHVPAATKEVPSSSSSPPSSSSRNKNKKRQQAGGNVTAAAVAAAAAAANVQVDMTEERYFAQYVHHCDTLYSDAASQGLHKAPDLFLTDDACYLCKDGGELIECDWKRAFGNRRGMCKCRKVYHEYCLAYSVPDGKTWVCPRHYCDGCASQNLAYMCKYCPVSMCEGCLPALAETYGNMDYAVLEQPEYGWEDKSQVQVIACHTCLRMFDKCRNTSSDLIAASHPAFSAQRLRAADDMSSADSVDGAGMFNKSAAPISLPARKRGERGDTRQSKKKKKKK